MLSTTSAAAGFVDVRTAAISSLIMVCICDVTVITARFSDNERVANLVPQRNKSYYSASRPRVFLVAPLRCFERRWRLIFCESNRQVLASNRVKEY